MNNPALLLMEIFIESMGADEIKYNIYVIREGTIKNGLSRDTGNTKGQSRMDYPETLVTRRDNQEWTIQRHWRI
jgi:hypothetical protein